MDLVRPRRQQTVAIRLRDGSEMDSTVPSSPEISPRQGVPFLVGVGRGRCAACAPCCARIRVATRQTFYDARHHLCAAYTTSMRAALSWSRSTLSSYARYREYQQPSSLPAFRVECRASSLRAPTSLRDSPCVSSPTMETFAAWQMMAYHYECRPHRPPRRQILPYHTPPPYVSLEPDARAWSPSSFVSSRPRSRRSSPSSSSQYSHSPTSSHDSHSTLDVHVLVLASSPYWYWYWCWYSSTAPAQPSSSALRYATTSSSSSVSHAYVPSHTSPLVSFHTSMSPLSSSLGNQSWCSDNTTAGAPPP
mmetsp:Transcript_6948/g.25341  ORF Transcript_6948/g.25341 Transcript_6948/m.25341 type:complete len:306 (-) Transcript_6948:515-1432(-)